MYFAVGFISDTILFSISNRNLISETCIFCFCGCLIFLQFSAVYDRTFVWSYPYFKKFHHVICVTRFCNLHFLHFPEMRFTFLFYIVLFRVLFVYYFFLFLFGIVLCCIPFFLYFSNILSLILSKAFSMISRILW